MTDSNTLSELNPRLINEQLHVKGLIEQIAHLENDQHTIQENARQLMETMRTAMQKRSGFQNFLSKYDLSSKEGVLLMCLAEALLRVPDAHTTNLLIEDKISSANWQQHLDKQDGLFINASTWGLMLTGKMLKKGEEAFEQPQNLFDRLKSIRGEPFIRQAIKQAIAMMSDQFIMGQTIKKAISRAKKHEKQGCLYSYDMLGEAAITQKDADLYTKAYVDAIDAIGKHKSKTMDHKQGPGISIKLSALHPRYEVAKKNRVMQEMLPVVKALCLKAKQYNLGLNIDAEESDRLALSLELFDALAHDPDLKDWPGLGLAVQAYQKCALQVIDHLEALSAKTHRQFMVRLVKGAYWDYEIKLSQQLGLTGFPVFTRKEHTDISYIACAQKLLNNPKAFYPQFATHNARTIATIMHMAQDRVFEFQCLHGMTEGLYEQIVGQAKYKIPTRIYAPVGNTNQLLSYLVRRLLENGANSSFLNQINSSDASLESLIQIPIDKARKHGYSTHPDIPLPVNLYQPDRANSMGMDLNQPAVIHDLNQSLKHALKPTNLSGGKNVQTIINPADNNDTLGEIQPSSPQDVKDHIQQAHDFFPDWQKTPVVERAAIIDNIGQTLQDNSFQLFNLLVTEAGKTWADADSEIREAIDFCRYYAHLAKEQFSSPHSLPGPSGESNILCHQGRGPTGCISPWNFPLAIFTGGIVGALASGNTVVAKPAEQTPLIASLTVKLMKQAGVPDHALALLIGPGKIVGEQMVQNPLIKSIVFTGSVPTAQHINRTLSQRAGPIGRLIAETGGQNTMIVDSSALPEQVVQDVIQSSFQSAGQRCSALRVLYLQEDVADTMIDMLIGATSELTLGNPKDLATDIGPMIDDKAKQTMQDHVKKLSQTQKLIYQMPVPTSLKNGHFFGPTIFEIKDINVLDKEVFGPILHIIRYKGKQLPEVIKQINHTGFGLTLGIHSRINKTAEYICERVRVGNIYINRNMIGAVVGTQPFGGQGLSGTGPKAGGPEYLKALSTEVTITNNISAIGGDPKLLNL